MCHPALGPAIELEDLKFMEVPMEKKVRKGCIHGVEVRTGQLGSLYGCPFRGGNKRNRSKPCSKVAC